MLMVDYQSSVNTRKLFCHTAVSCNPCGEIRKRAKSKNRMQIIGTPRESDNISMLREK